MKKVLKISALVVAGLLVFLLVLLGATQTQMFRDRLRAVALSNLDSLLYADVQLGDVTGNLVTGFSVAGVSVRLKEDTLLSVERIDLRYNLLEIPGKRISISTVRLVRPKVRLVRGTGGVWNFKGMIRPRPADTAAPKPFDWVIDLRRFEIEDGTVSVVDSAALAAPDHPPVDTSLVEYHRFTLREVNLATAVSISREEMRSVISSLSFASMQPEFRLKQLSGDLLVSGNECRVGDLVITTGRSDLRISAAMKDVNLLGGMSLPRMRRNPIILTLRAHPLDLNELKEFIPQLAFLNGPISAEMEAGGEFGAVNVQKLDLQFGRTQLHVKGSVSNLHEPRNLLLNVKMTESKLWPADALVLMPTFHLPDYGSLGETTLNLEYDGSPKDFRTKLLLETTAGAVHSDMALKIGGPPTLQYNGDLSFNDLNLAGVLESASFESRLNGNLHVEGEGVKMENLAAAADVRIDSSEFRGMPLGNSRISARASARLLHAMVDISLGNMHSVVSGLLDERNDTLPTFSVNGNVASLNLGDFTRDSSYNSDLTMVLQADGTGLTPDALGGTLALDLTNSSFGGYRMKEGMIRVSLDQTDPRNRHLAVESNIADVSLDGMFDLRRMAKLIAFEQQNIRRAVAEKISLARALAPPPEANEEFAALGKELAETPTAIDAAYTLRVKDLEPISFVAGNRPFGGRGLLTGSMRGDFNALAVHGELDVSYFTYGDVEAGTLIQNGKMTLDIQNIRPAKVLRTADVQLHGSVGTLHINRSEFDSVGVGLTYRDEKASYFVGSALNRVYRVDLQGDAEVSEEAVDVRLDKLRAAYRDYAWLADAGSSLHITSGALSLNNLTLRRGAEKISIGGSLGSGGGLSASVVADRIDLDALKYIVAKEEFSSGRRAFAGVANMALTASGSLDDPVYTASLSADGIAFRNVPVGQLRGSASYDNDSLGVDLQIREAAGAGQDRVQLTVSGSMPLDLTLRSVEERLPDKPMNMSIRSDGLQMGILDPLLPTFNELSGLLKCDVKLVGTPRSPDYEGSITIADCSFLFVPNNIHYTCEGTFQPTKDRIRVVDAVIRNLRADQRPGALGVIHVQGDFALREFIPTDFNLAITGQLLVVKESTLSSSLSVEGDLAPEIGPDGLHFTGTIENSLLKGSLLISNSSLTFPPAHASASRETEMSVPVIFVDDTVKAHEVPGESLVARYFRTGSGGAGMDEGGGGERKTKSFLDGVRYDLTIETSGGSNEIKMTFNPVTNEELAADIEGKFTIAGTGTQWFGELNVQRAYYNFFKRFSAEGKINFTGDLMDPGLNITAQYTGTRTIHDTTSGENPSEAVVVTFAITGTRVNPKLAISMTIDGVDYATYQRGPKSDDVQSDAIQFILYGSFPLSSSQKNDVASNVRTSVGPSLLTGAASLLTGTLANFLRQETGFINSVELNYGGGATFGESADIRLSGVAFNGLWRYGGKILEDPVSNANFSLMYSFGTILSNKSLRNLMFELERKVEAAATLGQSTDLRRVSSARVFYRISW